MNNRLSQLRDERSKLLAQVGQLVREAGDGKRPITVKETAGIDDLLGKIQTLNEEVARWEELASLEQLSSHEINTPTGKKKGRRTLSDNQASLIEALRKLGIEKDHLLRKKQLEDYKTSLSNKPTLPLPSDEPKESRRFSFAASLSSSASKDVEEFVKMMKRVKPKSIYSSSDRVYYTSSEGKK